MSHTVNGDAAAFRGDDTAPYSIYQDDRYELAEQQERWRQLFADLIYGLTDQGSPTRLIPCELDDILRRQEDQLKTIRADRLRTLEEATQAHQTAKQALHLLEEVRRAIPDALTAAEYGFQRGQEAPCRHRAEVVYGEPVPAALIHALNGPVAAEPVGVVLAVRGHTVVAYVTPGHGCDPVEIWESIQRAVPKQAVA